MISLVIGLRPFKILFSIVRSMCSLLAHELWPPACLTSERSRRMRSPFSRIRRLLLGRTPIGNSSNFARHEGAGSTAYQTLERHSPDDEARASLVWRAPHSATRWDIRPSGARSACFAWPAHAATRLAPPRNDHAGRARHRLYNSQCANRQQIGLSCRRSRVTPPNAHSPNRECP